MDQRINDRGLWIDTKACRKARKIVEHVQAQMDREMKEVTVGAVTAVTNVTQLTTWIKQRGVDASSVTKDTVTDLLARDDLPDDCRRALELRRDGSQSSTSKIDAMLNSVGSDGRARGLLQFHGAFTGRAAGRRIQVQNLPRGEKQYDAEDVLRSIEQFAPDEFEMLYDSPRRAISSALRGLIAAPKGRELSTSDLSNIEGRCLAWLAGEQWKLDAFQAFDDGKGPDLYLVAAGRIYGLDPLKMSKDSPERQIGKVSELALGYGGGPGAYASMAAVYGLKIGDHEQKVRAALDPAWFADAEDAYASYGSKMSTGLSEGAWLTAEAIKRAWRHGHPKTVQFWYDLESAAISAVNNPGAVTQAGHIKYRVVGSWLVCQLPSKRCIAYAYPKVKKGSTPWGADKETLYFKGVNSRTRKWGEQKTYGGSLAENVTQAVARDVLFEAMLDLDRRGHDIVMHVHDEVVTEQKAGAGGLATINDVLERPPAWAEGLPLAAAGWEGRRYRKD